MLAVAIGSFMFPFLGSSINVAIPSIGREFSADAVLLNWVVTSYFLTSVMFLIPLGRVADIYGRKKIFMLGFLAVMITSFLSATATTVAWLIFFRFLQGIGGAMFTTTGVAMLSSVTKVSERGKALGINSAVVYFGSSAGPFLGGILTDNFGWRSIFYAIMPVCLLVVFLVYLKLDGEWTSGKDRKLNYGSSLLYSFSFLVLMYGFSTVPEKSSSVLIALGITCFAFFLWREPRVDNPLIDLNLFKKNRIFAYSNLALLINHSAIYAVIFLLSMYLQYIQGLSAQTVGIILITKSVMQGMISPLAGRLSDRLEPKYMASTGMVFIATALFIFSFLGSNTSLTVIIFTLVIIGLGIGLFASPNTNAIMGSVDLQDYGISSATLATMRQSGNLFSMAIVMLVFALVIGRTEITPLYYAPFLKATRIAFFVYALLCCSGVYFSLARGKIRCDRTP